MSPLVTQLSWSKHLLILSNIIEQGTSNFIYQAVQDNIFDKVFRGVYQAEIDGFTPDEIKEEYRELYKNLEGKFNKYKGEFAAYVVMNHLFSLEKTKQLFL